MEPSTIAWTPLWIGEFGPEASLTARFEAEAGQTVAEVEIDAPTPQ